MAVYDRTIEPAEIKSPYEAILCRLMRSGDVDSTAWPIVEVHLSEREIIIGEQVGWPLNDEDETHNCDAMGCGQQHIMLRLVKVEQQDAAAPPANPEP